MAVTFFRLVFLQRLFWTRFLIRLVSIHLVGGLRILIGVCSSANFLAHCSGFAKEVEEAGKLSLVIIREKPVDELCAINQLFDGGSPTTPLLIIMSAEWGYQIAAKRGATLHHNVPLCVRATFVMKFKQALWGMIFAFLFWRFQCDETFRNDYFSRRRINWMSLLLLKNMHIVDGNKLILKSGPSHRSMNEHKL